MALDHGITLDTSLNPLFYVPTIVTWDRLEPRPRKEDFDKSLQAPVRDALWMLTRQWQMGEFQGEDAATPIFAKIQTNTTRLTKFRDRTGNVRPMDYSQPLETRVEQMPFVLTLDLRLQMGRRWLKMVKKQGFARESDYLAAYKSEYAIALPPEDETGASVYAHRRVHQLYSAVSGRSMDGGAWWEHLVAGGDPEHNIGADSTDIPTLRDLAKDFAKWFRAQYTVPDNVDEICWAPSQLEYQAAVSAPKSTTPGDELVLVADKYHHGHLDWYSFDIAPDEAHLGTATPAPPVLNTETLTFLPAPIEFSGMPNTRWWEFEDRQTDFGDIDANTTDTAKLLLMEFALLYANDWFLIPYNLPVGSFTRINGLVIRDSFGQNTWVTAAGSGAEDDWQRWNMYSLNQRGDATTAENGLLLPPAVGKILEGEAFEAVNLTRDEMSNMVWGIETKVPMDTGLGKRGLNAGMETRRYHKELLGISDEEETTATDAKIKFKLMNNVRENWIPFIPVHIPGSNREIQLQRAAMLRIFGSVDTGVKVEPRTEILREGLADGDTYFIFEEEVPRAGAIVKTSFQRVRWNDGKVIVWVGRRKLTGRGEKSGGLRFDRIRNVRG